ncbi:MAG: SPOR domain-containing protein [Gammaproteobacteria bacterium]|nr:SPOR domain-containing protein [Gammaproteobacteria bacterium]
METTLKQRLIGAAVIIALAVIFVPMILDGSGRQESVALDMEVPPEPTFTFESDLPDAKKLEELPPIEKSIEATENSEIDTADSEIPNEESLPDSIKENQSNEPKVKSTISTVAKTISEPVVVEATENHIKTNPALSAWAIQVAAFGEKGKALALQEKLLASNLSAFTEQSGSGNKVVYRVKVGPELKRENADKLRDKIEKEHGLKGSFVTKHP